MQRFPLLYSFRVAWTTSGANQGFRSTASSLLNESGNWPPDVIEHALAHQDKNAIRAIYNRTSYWNVRVEMMQAWSDQLDALKKQAAGLPEGPKSEPPPPKKRPPAEPRKAPARTRTPADLPGRI